VGLLVQWGILGHPARRLRAAADELVARHPQFRFDGYEGGATAYVADTIRTVFDAFFSTGGFEECLVKTVNRGDDADTTAAIAGAIAGARYGLERYRPAARALEIRPAPGAHSSLAARIGGLSPLRRPPEAP
jgi:ADP-ribosyl-[dinitrogen reductase] hydrolase